MEEVVSKSEGSRFRYPKVEWQHSLQIESLILLDRVPGRGAIVAVFTGMGLAQKFDRLSLFLLAAGSAIGVSAIYLTQPILNHLGVVMRASVKEMGLVTTFTQIGFGLGIVFVVPLGDIVSKKRLIIAKLLLASAALTVTGFANNYATLLGCSLFLGVFASVAQDFVPLAAELSLPERRGQTIGTVMAGLLLGILGSRIFSGFLVQWSGWRTPFFFDAGLTLLVSLLVWVRIPSHSVEHRSTYLSLIKSIGRLVIDHPLLRLSALAHGLVGLTFSAFWTILSFHLGDGAFHLRPAQIGAFALAGFAGAAMAPLAGRMADRRGPLTNIRLGLALVVVAFCEMLILKNSLLAVAFGAVLFDLGVQISMISHQTIIYALEPAARSRINAVYVGSLFGFFAVGSLLAGWAYVASGWSGVMVLCLVSCSASVVVHLALSLQWHRRPRADTVCAESHHSQRPLT